MDLNIDFTKTSELGARVLSQGEEFKSLLDNIKKINTELQACWQGDDAKKYSGRVEEQAQVMQELLNTINSIGEYLQKVSEAYREFVSQNAESIN